MGKKSRARGMPKRRQPKRDSYDRVLIVCEGSKTEPYYFQALIDYFKLNSANVVVCGDSGSAPKSVVQYAKRQQRTDPDFDHIYCVFDRDEHTSYTEALRNIQDAKPSGLFYAANSVPCFEYWLLLHLSYSNKPYARSGKRSPAAQAEADLKKLLPEYMKGNRQILSKFIEKIDSAIENAERANRQAKRNDTDNPSTQVHKLVAYLRDLKK